jgi:hypothetical protein
MDFLIFANCPGPGIIRHQKCFRPGLFVGPDSWPSFRETLGSQWKTRITGQLKNYSAWPVGWGIRPAFRNVFRLIKQA